MNDLDQLTTFRSHEWQRDTANRQITPAFDVFGDESVSYNDALAIITDRIEKLDEIEIPVHAAVGRIAAKRIRSDCALPASDYAALDGYAVNTAELFDWGMHDIAVTDDHMALEPGTLKLFGARAISCGAPISPGFDAVVSREHIRVLEQDESGKPTRIRIQQPVRTGQHVASQGDDIHLGTTLGRPGQLLAPHHVYALSALGKTRVTVVRQPRVAIITVVQTEESPSSSVSSAHAPLNHDTLYVEARLMKAGAYIAYKTTVENEPWSFLAALDAAQDANVDLIVQIHTAIPDELDFRTEALYGLNAELLLQRIRMTLEEQFLFAHLAEGALFFGLSSNPLAYAAQLRFFIEPAIRVMLGMPKEQPFEVALAAPCTKSTGQHGHLLGRLGFNLHGELRAEILPLQKPSRIAPLLAANIWASLPENATTFTAGQRIQVYGLGHLDVPAPEFNLIR